MVDTKIYAAQILHQMQTQSPLLSETLICSWLDTVVQAEHHRMVQCILSNDPGLRTEIDKIMSEQGRSLHFQDAYKSEVIRANSN
jgi:hypothetical protein